MTWSESAYLDGVSADGRTGFVTRLARNPDDGTSWLWLHLFTPAGMQVAIVRDDLPCGPQRAADDGSSAVYAVDAPGVSARFERSGPKEAPTAAAVRVEVDGTSLDARFTPTATAGSNLPGRTEVLGRVAATVTTPSSATVIEAGSQLHEQHQDAPRFTVPFTYGTLRGEHLGIVFLIGPVRSGGFVVRDDGIHHVTNVEIEPVGSMRALRLALEGGGAMDVEVQRTHHYLLGINGHDRESSLVRARAGSESLSGCVNDWQPEERR